MATLTIGKLARATGLNVETIRYYERCRLLEAPPRDASGYRAYPRESIERLRFVRRAKQLGFALEEIRELLDLRRLPEAENAQVKAMVEEKIQVIDARLRELAALKGQLRQLSALCDGEGAVRHCPILEFLNHAPGEQGASRVHGEGQ